MSGISTCARPDGTKSAACPRQMRHWLAKVFLQALSMALFIAAAAAQTASGPINDGRLPRPTQPQIDGGEDNTVGREVDRLYDEIMRASEPQTRRPTSQQLKAGVMQ
jgi:hypothetical protein